MFKEYRPHRVLAYWGAIPDMEGVISIAKENGCMVFEDCAGVSQDQKGTKGIQNQMSRHSTLEQ